MKANKKLLNKMKTNKDRTKKKSKHKIIMQITFIFSNLLLKIKNNGKILKNKMKNKKK